LNSFYIKPLAFVIDSFLVAFYNTKTTLIVGLDLK